MTFKRFLIAALLVASAATVQARSSVALVLEHERIVLPATNGQPASVEAVRRAIVKGGARREWVVRNDSPGKLTLAYNKRNKHEVVVDVLYDEGGFQIRYVSSVNMNYDLNSGAPMIHPHYDDWVNNLSRDISREFAAGQPAP